MSTIKIVINTVGDVVRNNIVFRPYMSNKNIKSMTIFFPPTFILTSNKILKAVKDTTSVSEVLTTPAMFEQLVRYYTDRAKGYKRISLEKSVSLGIIDKNFEFMRNLWLKNNSQIIIDDRVYNIIKSEITNTRVPRDRTNLQFEMTVDVKLIRKDRDSMINRQKISCDEQRENIDKIYESLYGVPFFSYREKSTKQQNAPVMFTSDKGSTTGRRQTGNPYVPPQYNVRPMPFYLVPASNNNRRPQAYPMRPPQGYPMQPQGQAYPMQQAPQGYSMQQAQGQAYPMQPQAQAYPMQPQQAYPMRPYTRRGGYTRGKHTRRNGGRLV